MSAAQYKLDTMVFLQSVSSLDVYFTIMAYSQHIYLGFSDVPQLRQE